jgi:FtsZ-binding cell division protein ZapB
MNKTNTYKLLDLIKQLVEKVNTNANNINILAREIAKLKKEKNDNKRNK